MKLIHIPKNKYETYRLDCIFNCYKWDPQFFDSNTIAKYVLVISEDEHEELKNLTERLSMETIKAEEFLNNNLKYTKKLYLPRKIGKELNKMKNYDSNKHIRLMRYDFHPTIEDKWAISEVNSDVPGGFAEASLMPKVAINILKNENYWSINFGDILVDAISKKTKQNGKIMLVHCTSYSDDRQVMQFLGDKLTLRGFKVIYSAADHIVFKNKKAYSILGGNEGEIDAIVRFTPLEWLKDIKPKRWQGYFDTVTTSCNHPIAIFAQTKRFPLIWNELEKQGIDLSTWKRLLPETIDVKSVKNQKEYIFKPACGRVGENISIKEACKNDEYEKILKDVKKNPKDYLAQKRFNSKPIEGENGETYHLCLGSYSVDGNHAGYYARISNLPRIDSYAADIPVLIERKNK